jgi:hypothetical protein
MNDMNSEGQNNTEHERVAVYDPPDWITTEQLDAELFNAIMEDSSGITGEEEGDFEDIDAYFDDEYDEEDEAEQRRSTFQLLVLMRPQLAALRSTSRVVQMDLPTPRMDV